MVTSIRSWSLRSLMASLMLSSISAAADDAVAVVRLGARTSEGVVRVSDQQTPGLTYRAQSPELSSTSVQIQDGVTVCPNGAYSDCPQNVVYGQNPFVNCLRMQCQSHYGRHQMQAAIMQDYIHQDLAMKHAWARGKFGYFVPTGSGGAGSPLIGCYNMAYPVDPAYFDGRDGQVYAAPGYGGPVSVPLAPVVNHTYNYGWGVPSSRLTPVLHPASMSPVAVTPDLLAAPVAR